MPPARDSRLRLIPGSRRLWEYFFSRRPRRERRGQRLAEVADFRVVAVGCHEILNEVVGADGDEIDVRQHVAD